VSVLHIPMNDLIHRLHELDECKHIIVVCVVGGRSAKVCEFLETKGYEHISNLTGGILAWQSLNY
jgi:rhodanese-related sulfurtransferase